MYFPVEFRFSKHQTIHNSRISTFLGMNAREQTERPIYYIEKKVSYKGILYSAMILSLFFENNPGYCWGTLGQHKGDIEHLVVLHNDYEAKHVYFGAHGNAQGTWVPYDECEKNAEDALVVYVSPTSHGFYPRANTYWRIGGFANDVCLGDGERWSPSYMDFEDASKQSWTHSHYQVVRGINTPMNLSPPASRGIKPWERFFLFVPVIRNHIKNIKRLEYIS